MQIEQLQRRAEVAALMPPDDLNTLAVLLRQFKLSIAQALPEREQVLIAQADALVQRYNVARDALAIEHMEGGLCHSEH